jgi:pyruvate dehydrogenase E1 component alpha subunit
VLAYFGEGASSEGDFHEALNLAGVTRAPVIFLLQNNNWAISTPRSGQSAAPNLALRAQGYGFPGRLVDGNDVLAVFASVSEAVAHARAGGGPALIEALTYRMSFHNTTDDPSRYVDPAEMVQAARNDPTERVMRFLTQAGFWNEEKKSQLESEAAAEVEDAIAWAEQQEPARPESIFDHGYVEEPARVTEQRRAFPGR